MGLMKATEGRRKARKPFSLFAPPKSKSMQPPSIEALPVEQETQNRTKQEKKRKTMGKSKQNLLTKRDEIIKEPTPYSP